MKINKRGIAAMLLEAAVFISLFALVGDSEPQKSYRGFRDDLMDTFMSITAYDSKSWKMYAGASEMAVNGAFERIESVHGVFDVNNPGSEVSCINTLAGTGEFEVIYGHIMQLTEWSLRVNRETKGAFNPALGPLIELWGIGTEHERVPSQAEIDAALLLCNVEDISINIEEMPPTAQRPKGYEEYSMSLAEPGMSLNFGGIAKGKACMSAAQTLGFRGIESALIDLGGDIYAHGTKPDGSPWRIGLRSPLGDGAVIGTIDVSDTAVMTSGSYERYFERDGKRYHHILDPATGYPAESGLLSVTVLSVTFQVPGRRDDTPTGSTMYSSEMSDNPIIADAFSTAFFVMGLEESREFLLESGLARIFELSAIFITEELEVHLVGELAQSFKLTDKRFTLAHSGNS